MARPKIVYRDPNIRCKICGKLANEDSHFYYKLQLCNRHYIQMYRYGKIVSVDEINTKITSEEKICCICGDTLSQQFTVWHKKDDNYGKVFCNKHYKQLKSKGEIVDPMPSYYGNIEDRVCDLCGSKNDVIYSAMFQGMYCRVCYSKKHHALRPVSYHIKAVNEYIIDGDIAIIFFDSGEETIIDLEDLDFIIGHKWYCNAWNYAETKIDGKACMMQSLLIDNPQNMIIDHKNRNTLDNRKSNLRLVTKSQNAMNTKVPANNTSGVMGVCYNKKQDKWRAYITINQQQINLGYYKEFNEAVKNRLLGEKKYFGEYAPQQHLYIEYGIE